MSLEIQGIHKTFRGRKGAQHVLRDVTVSVASGEFVSLIGHSGCGKSTLLGCAAGLVRPDAGTVHLDGKLVEAPGPERAVVFQHYSLLPRLSLVDNVRIAAKAAHPDRASAVADERAERYLRAVGLWEHRDKRPHQVSGGMQQRTAVARAFAVEPRVLLLDEPFGALDALTRARLQGQLVELWGNESATEIVLMVTHGIDEAILLSDRVVVMGNPPGPSVRTIIPISVPRPRDRVSIANHPAFLSAQAELMRLLTEDAAEAA